MRRCGCIHLIVVAALVVAAVDVYKIKFESTVQAERLAKLRVEIRRERDAIAALRAEWAQLDNPARIQALAQRHLALKPIDPTQIEHARPPAGTAARAAVALPPVATPSRTIDRSTGSKRRARRPASTADAAGEADSRFGVAR